MSRKHLYERRMALRALHQTAGGRQVLTAMNRRHRTNLMYASTAGFVLGALFGAILGGML